MTAAFAVSAVAVAGALSGGRASAVTGHSFAAFRSAEVAADVSANSAGYALIGSSTTYTSATGTREEPKVTCEASDSSAFWVGLGGYSETSQALEQVGTSADCDPTTACRAITRGTSSCRTRR